MLGFACQETAAQGNAISVCVVVDPYIWGGLERFACVKGLSRLLASDDPDMYKTGWAGMDPLSRSSMHVCLAMSR